MREIKFRVWDKPDELFFPYGCMSYFGISNFIQGDYDVLMQYTGLKDKNGVEIYEGDIIEVNNWRYVVKFKNGKFLCFQNVDDELATGSINSETDEVIGNIYENPELLKGE